MSLWSYLFRQDYCVILTQHSQKIGHSAHMGARTAYNVFNSNPWADKEQSALGSTHRLMSAERQHIYVIRQTNVGNKRPQTFFFSIKQTVVCRHTVDLSTM